MRSTELARGFQSIATPACFAAATSRGRWRLARHLAAIDRAIIDTIRGRGPSLLIVEAPPRHGKSELISKYLPAWFLGTFPHKRVMLAAYGAGFARNWGRKARELLSEFGPCLFGVSVRGDVRASNDWGLVDFEGGMVTSGVGGPMTGRGADLLIIDDPIKNAEEAHSPRIHQAHWDWWESTASTRIEPGGCAIIIATRWHEEDLSGRLIRAAESEDGHAVRRLHLPALAEPNDVLGRTVGEALWPERWSAAALEKRRRASTPFWWLAMYQQTPTRDARMRWPDEYFGPHIWATTWPREFDMSALAVDPSKGKQGGDFSALLFVGVAEGLLWVDASMARRPAERMVTDAIAFAERYHPDVVAIESNAFQFLLGAIFDYQCRDLRRPPLPISMMESVGSKSFRISALGALFERMKFRFRDTPDVRLLIKQFKEFPLGEHDDGPDAVELALRALGRLSPGTFASHEIEFAAASPEY